MKGGVEVPPQLMALMLILYEEACRAGKNPRGGGAHCSGSFAEARSPWQLAGIIHRAGWGCRVPGVTHEGQVTVVREVRGWYSTKKHCMVAARDDSESECSQPLYPSAKKQRLKVVIVFVEIWTRKLPVRTYLYSGDWEAIVPDYYSIYDKVKTLERHQIRCA
jgi:hypothetical protein